MNRMVALFAFLVIAAMIGTGANAETHGALVRCEYARFGGMENEHYSILLERGEQADLIALDDVDWETGAPVHAVYEASGGALSDLEAFIEAYAPETWESLPDREEYELDAPGQRVTVTYEDGTEYCVTDGREWPEGKGAFLWKVSRFLESYTVENAQCFELSFSSFMGGGPTYTPVISEPEKLAWTSYTRYESSADPLPPGSAYEEVFVFRGRVPGRVELSFDLSGPLMPTPLDGQELQEPVYVLNVDNDYKVTLVETLTR